MKQSIKVLVLGCMTIGALAGCDWGTSSKESQSSSDSHSSEVTSTLPTTSSSELPSTSLPSSSTTTSSSSVSTSPVPSTTSSREPVATGITLNTNNVKKDYLHGDALDLTGLVVNVNYDNGSNTQTTDYTTNPANGTALNTVGAIKVTVSYLTFTADFNVTVSAKLTGIAISTDNVKKEYEQGEALDLTGLVVTAQYSDNTTANVTDYTTNPANGTVFNEIKEETITVSYNNFNETFKVNVVKATKKAWTAEEAKIMTDHLHGVELPYSGFEESVVTWNSEYETLYIKGGAATDEDLVAYARALSSIGFVMISQTSYTFRKVISTDNGDRYVKVAYYIDEDNEFYLEAYDPFLYEFPTQIALYFAYMNFDSFQTPPAFDADRYEVKTQNMAIYCYKDTTTAVADYTAALNEAMWDTTGGYDANQKFYTAISPDKAYMIYYNYDAQYKSLDIYFAPVNFFNPAPIKAFYEKYCEYTIDIPAINVENANYYFYESQYNSEYIAAGQFEYVHAYLDVLGGEQADADAYAQVLAQAGWDVAGSSDAESKTSNYVAKKQVEELGLAKIDLIYNSHDGMYLIFYAALDPLPGATWPAEEVATVLGSDITDVLPPYEGYSTGYTVFPADMWGDDYVLVDVESGTENDCVAAYKETLVKNGYTVTPGGNYFSPKHQIRVTVYYGTSGTFTIEFVAGPFLEWPAARVARFIKEMYGERVTDVLPAFEGGEEYNTEFYDDEGLYISVSGDDFDGEQAVIDYTKVLTEDNGFTPVGEDEDGTPYYGSPNKQFAVCSFVDRWDDFYIFIPLPPEDENAWPTNDIADWISDKNFTDELPEYAGEYESLTFQSEPLLGQFIITLTLAESANAEDEASTYCYLLYQNEFKWTETLPFGAGEVYTSPSKEFTVTVASYEQNVYITLEEAEKDPVTGNGFPLDVLLEYFPTATDLPVITDEDVEYEANGYEGCAWVYATYTSEELAEAAVTSYCAALVEAGYTETLVWYDSYTAYMSKDGTFGVIVDYSGAEISITLYDSMYF